MRAIELRSQQPVLEHKTIEQVFNKINKLTDTAIPSSFSLTMPFNIQLEGFSTTVNDGGKINLPLLNKVIKSVSAKVGLENQGAFNDYGHFCANSIKISNVWPRNNQGFNLESSVNLKSSSNSNLKLNLQAIKTIKKGNYELQCVATLQNSCLNFTLTTVSESKAFK